MNALRLVLVATMMGCGGAAECECNPPLGGNEMATVTISGTAAIEDNYIRSPDGANNEFNNNGGHTIALAANAGGVTYRGIMRLDRTLIPGGTITGFRLKFYQSANANSTGSGNMDVYIIKDANAWVEGNSVGATEAGASSWPYTQHNSQAWAGSAGCGTSGTDYDADAGPPTFAFAPFTSGPDVLNSITLPTAWAIAWRDSTRVSNGILLRVRSETAGNCVVWPSTEAASHQPYFEIDYTPSPGKAPAAGIKRRVSE